MRLTRLLLLALPLSATAGPTDLDSQCLECHQRGGSRVEAPILEGQQAAYLANQLRHFQVRHRDSFPMSAVVAGMSADELEHLATELAERPWPVLRQHVDQTAAERGRRHAEHLQCDACHGTALTGNGAVPRLAGQHPGYLRRQLAAFAQSHRNHPAGTHDDTSLEQLDERTRHDLAAYLHASGSQ